MKVSICFYKKMSNGGYKTGREKCKAKPKFMRTLFKSSAIFLSLSGFSRVFIGLLKTNNKINWPKKITSHADFLRASSLVS